MSYKIEPMHTKTHKLNGHCPAWQRTAAFIVVLTLFLGALALTLKPFGDPDIWWHLKTGQWIVQHKALTGAEDPFSYTTPEPIARNVVRGMRAQWFGQVLLYAVYSSSGFWGLALLRAGLIVLPFVWLYIHFVRSSGGVRLGRLSAAAVLALPLLLPSTFLTQMYERPQAFSFVLSLAAVALLDRGRERFKRGQGPVWTPSVLLLPPVMALWSNLHGGYVIGVALVFAYLLGDAVDMLLGKLRGSRADVGGRVLLWYLAAVAFSCINPGGYHFIYSYLVIYPIDLLGLGASAGGAGGAGGTVGFAEYKSLVFFYENFRYPWALYSIIFLCVASLAFVVRLFGGKGRLETARILAFVFIAAFAFSFVRGVGFAFLVLTYYTGRFAAEAGGVRRIAAPAAAAAAALVFLLSVLSAGLIRPAVPGSWVDDRYPKEALEFVMQKGVQGPMYNYFVWGGYIIWRAHPGHEVFADGRSISGPVVVAATAILVAAEGWEDALDAYGVNFIVIPLISEETGLVSALALDIAQAGRGWSLIYLKRNHAVFVRRDSARNRELIDAYGLPLIAVLNESLNTVEALLRDNPGHLYLRGSKGVVLYYLGNYAEAAAFLKEAGHPIFEKYRRALAEGGYY